MKKSAGKQMITIAGGVLACSMQMMGCYPVTREDSTFGRVARYIDRHYAEDLSIEQLARQFYLSPYHLSHIFRQKTGYSLKQYVLRRRIGEAQMRLVNAQDSVQTISEAVGFADASYFSRIFSKYVGLTPTEYRKFRIGP